MEAGGSPRGDFGDTAYFGTVSTNSKGIAEVSFTLPDNVTTYRVTAHSANEDLYVGVNTKKIVSTLDFFVQFTEPRSVKTTDDLVLNATSVSEEKIDVEYEFKIKELDKTLTTTAVSNTIATVNFGKLPYGTYHAIIKGRSGDKEDIIEYEFNIIESAQEVKTKTTVDINDSTQITPSKNPIVLEIYNKNMNQYMEYIDFVETTLNERLDTQIAYNKVQEIKEKYYNIEYSVNYIEMSKYLSGTYLRNLENANADIVLTALISYYAENYYSKDYINSNTINEENLFEIYLLAAAKNEPVLTDLLYLKEEENIENYNKLLVTLSLGFLGDYQNAKELYNNIQLTSEEKNEFASIIAIIETFINKEGVTSKINEIMKDNPSDEYLRFAILSFFENNQTEIEEEATVKIVTNNINETIQINGIEVKTYTIYNKDLGNIRFETNSNDLIVSYYYQTLLENIQDENIKKDINIWIDGELKKNNNVTLVAEFENNYEGEVKIALPNSLRLSQSSNEYTSLVQEYYLTSNKIDYLTYYKTKDCTLIEIPLVVTLEGKYKFENIVTYNEGTYHISNSLDLEI